MKYMLLYTTFVIRVFFLNQQIYHPLYNNYHLRLQKNFGIILYLHRQLQLYSVRHWSSLARQVQTEKLRHIGRLIGGCHDDIMHYLTGCFFHVLVCFALIYMDIL